MKNLKFRFYDKTKKAMEYFEGIWNMPDPDYDFDEIQQFTGLVDRLGKEIYEGDILHFTSESINGYQKVIVEENLEVRFQDGAFTTKLEPLGNGLRRRDMFIIGNIYENPELVEDDI